MTADHLVHHAVSPLTLDRHLVVAGLRAGLQVELLQHVAVLLVDLAAATFLPLTRTVNFAVPFVLRSARAGDEGLQGQDGRLGAAPGAVRALGLDEVHQAPCWRRW